MYGNVVRRERNQTIVSVNRSDGGCGGGGGKGRILIRQQRTARIGVCCCGDNNKRRRERPTDRPFNIYRVSCKQRNNTRSVVLL